LQSKRGDRDDSDYTFRFVDGAIDLCGGKSINNLESNPYAMIVFDEWDRIALNLLRDPIGLARSRSMSRAGRSLVYGWGHPTSKEIGVGQAYWNLSDRRRGFVIHAACGHEFYLQWDHVRDGAYYCPNCGSEIPDGERHAMSRRLVLKSSLPPEVAATRKWIGWHFSHLYYPHILVSEMWTDWLRCEGDDAATETFVNKRLGECHEAKKIVISPEALWKCIDKREPFMRGQVPRWVRFLTAGQDSRQMELHYAIWGWGLRRIDKETTMVSAALVDWGVVPRVKSETFYESEYHVFDKLIYDRTFDRGMKVWACGHDAGYAPTQIAIHTYCRCHQGRAFPTKGANLKHSSSSMAPYIRRGNALNIELKNGEILRDERQWILNTFTLKQDWYGWIGQERTLVDGRVAQMICLPTDVEAEFIKQSSSEYLTIGERNGELVWKHAGANHWADCNTIAQAMYLKDDRLQDRLTADEAQRANGPTRQWPSEREPVDRAAIGRGGGPEYG
jgi:phage terminase large subunit GpA-like protein